MKTSMSDRLKLPAHARARLVEEEYARNVKTPLFKDGRATRPEDVSSPQLLPAKWYRVFEKELIARLSNTVPYDETRRYALSVTLIEWRRELAKRNNKRNQQQLWEAK